MAQQVFLTLGRLSPTQVLSESRLADRLALQRPARFEHSREVIARWWRRTFGSPHAAPVMDNGAGLSRSESITPDALANLLRHAARHPQGERFVQSLAVAGVSGTTARMAQAPLSAARGNAWLKTGTLRDVSGIAGYVNAANGARYVVVGFINHPNAPAARPALEAMVEWTAAQRD
jgi:D-alanyl-D-alanine carboxypeptidase/D-alanyl-D-alanine-endopeptidase (penicillin-binding protein 4)